MPRQAQHDVAPAIRFIREPELLARIGLSAAQVDIMEGRGEFPRRIPLSHRTIGWIEAEVLAWQASRIALRDDADALRQRRPRVEALTPA